MFPEPLLTQIALRDVGRGILHVESINNDWFRDYFQPAMATFLDRELKCPLFVFNSPGGNYDQGFPAHDAMRAYPGGTIGLVEYECSSMAIILLQACSLRVVRPNSTMLLHWGQAQIKMSHREWLNPNRVARRVEGIQRDAARYDNVLLSSFRGSRELLHDYYDNEVRLVGQQIVDAGLADYVSTESREFFLGFS